MKSIILYCDFLLDMKGGEVSIKKDKVLEISKNRIQKIYPWERTFTKDEVKRIKRREELQEKDFRNEKCKEEKNEKCKVEKSHDEKVQTEEASKENKVENKVEIHLKDHIVLPGLINTHTHLPMSLFRGFAEDLSFQDWLFNHILPVEKKMLNPQFVKIGAELSAIECIENGITTVYDMYSFSENIGEVFEEYNLRGFFGEDINDTRPHWESLMDSLCNRYLNHDRIRPALAPHAPYTCGDDILKKVLRYSENLNLPILIHVSETQHEVKESKKKYSLTPVERLHKLGITNQNSLFIHSVHLSSFDIQILEKTKTSISYNPESNMKLSSGIAPIKTLLELGVNVGLGTDGAASNNDLNLFSEMDVGSKLQKLFWKEGESIITSKDMLKMTSWGAAKALNQEAHIGSLEEGKLADIIAVKIDQPHFYPQGDLFSHLVYSGGKMDVSFVMCHGRILKQGGKRQIGRNKDLIFEDVEKMRNQMK